jgi:ABC-type antimicrobial peptide transport system permease subunit
VGLAIGVVYGTFVFLLILSVFFALVTFLVSKLPVPERFSFKFLLLILIFAVISGLLTLALPTFGLLLLVLTAVGFFIVLVPRSWKVNTRMALRNIGRQRARTTTTLLALFVGIFTIGLTLALGQNVSNLLNNAIANVLPFNVIAYASGSQATALQSQITTLPGYESSTAVYQGSFAPLAINGQPLSSILQNTSQYPSGKGDLGKEGTLALLSSMQGYDVASGSLPSSITILDGRNLDASDAGTNNILIPRVLTQQTALQHVLTVGSTITVVSQDGQHRVTLTVVGVYAASGLKIIGSTAIYGTKDTLTALSPGGQVQESFTLKIDPAKVNQALDKVSQIAPDSIALSIADIGDYVTQYLNDIILVLIVVASLSLLAGIIIIANAVALAMLERRRELGILKAVGYTSRTVLGEVLIENAAIGGLGALLAMLLVTFITSLLGHLTFKSSFSVNGLVVIGLILGSAVLAALTSLLVAWGSVRVRPLEVLRYE